MSKTFTVTDSYDYKDAQYDLDSLFRYAASAPFDLPAEITLYACVMGENDESDWYWIFEHDGQVYYAQGGCDYTGWDCRSWGTVEPVDSVEAALAQAPEKDSDFDGNRPIRQYLEAMVKGEQQIGVL